MCVCVVAGCHSCGTTFVIALLFAPRGCLGCEARVLLQASPRLGCKFRLGCCAARLSIGVTIEGGSPSPSDRRPVHRVALTVLSVSKPVVGAPQASPKCALAVTRPGGTSFLQAPSCVCVCSGQLSLLWDHLCCCVVVRASRVSLL